VSLVLNFFVLLILFFLACFFASSETALYSLSKIEKRRLEKAHPRLSRWVMGHLDKPRRTLSTILIGNMVVHILATAVVTLTVIKFWGPQGLGIALVLFTLILIVFGEILPKTFAVQKNEAVALSISIPLRVFSAGIYPLRILLRFVTDRILKLLIREKKDPTDQISEEEINALVKIGEEEGVLDEQERYMIQKLLQFGERPVKDIMTPRIDMAALDTDDSREKHMEIIREFHFEHFPVYQEAVDNILGVISVQEYLLHPERDSVSLVRQPFFIPESKRIDDLLAEFREREERFAICVDEYGGTAGIVTAEDILEEIFGEYYDEYAKVERPIRAVGNREYIVEAKIALSEFNEYFSTHLESEEASTLSGFILEKLGEVPKKGKKLSTPECEILIHEVMRQRRIRSVLVRLRL